MFRYVASSLVALGLVAGSAAGQVTPKELKWGPAPAVLPKGAKLAVLSGDPSKPAMYVVRLKMPKGYKIPAHHHPTDEYVTVVSGDFNAGMGDKLNMAKGKALGPGGFFQASAGMNHYAWSKEGGVVQVQGMGPFQIIYVNPKDDPTHK
jgi:quercetin dioxygenase-like cupin family protein